MLGQTLRLEVVLTARMEGHRTQRRTQIWRKARLGSPWFLPWGKQDGSTSLSPSFMSNMLTIHISEDCCKKELVSLQTTSRCPAGAGCVLLVSERGVWACADPTLSTQYSGLSTRDSGLIPHSASWSRAPPPLPLLEKRRDLPEAPRPRRG